MLWWSAPGSPGSRPRALGPGCVRSRARGARARRRLRCSTMTSAGRGGGGRRPVVGPTQDRARSRGGAPGRDVPHHTDRPQRDRVRGPARRYRARIPRISPLVLADVERAARLDRMARGVPSCALGAPNAAKLDPQTAGTWLRATSLTSPGRMIPGAQGSRRSRGAAGGHVAAPRPLLHPLGRQPRPTVRDRGRRTAGSLRRRLAAPADRPDGEVARQGAAGARSARCAASSTVAMA